MHNRDRICRGRESSRTFRSLALGLLLVAESAAAGPTFVVNSVADVPAGPNTTDGICETATGNGVCTLRAAIMEANSSVDAIVRVPAGFYALTRTSTAGVHPENGDLDVLARMKIEGDGPSVSVIDANSLSRVFRVALPVATDQVEMRGLTIQNGSTPLGEGGGIASYSALLLENMHVRGNAGFNGGGVLANGAKLTMKRSIVEGNASAVGGGLLILSSPASVIEDSRIESNIAGDGQSGDGGGIYLSGGSLRIERTGVVGNVAAYWGGGLFVQGDLDAANMLVHANLADDLATPGSGIFVDGGSANLVQVTMTRNSARPNTSSGALHVRANSSGVLLGRSIVTSNVGALYQCFGTIISGDYNIRPNASSCLLQGQTLNTVNASGFDTLSFNGGFSPDVASGLTVAAGVVPGSACLDLLGAPLTTDFRGHRRPGTACDIGAHDSAALYRPAQQFGVNLLRNGGAIGEELGLAASTANPANVSLYQAPYWEQSGRAVQLIYGAPGYPTRNDAPSGSGHKFLSGGIEPVTNASQTIDVSAFAAAIDAGNLPYQIGGSFGGRTAEEDRATMSVEFYSEGFGFLDSFVLGGFSAADRGNQTKLLRAQRVGVLPIGTRIIRVGVGFERVGAGIENDGYADAISVTLPEPDVAASLGSALMAFVGLARSRAPRGTSTHRTIRSRPERS